MRAFIGVASCLTIALVIPSCGSRVPAHGTLYTNGHWFDGRQFVAADFYVAEGLLTHRKPSQLDAKIDLAGGFVVPPFAEAHNHNVESSRFDRVNNMYLDQGVFYVKNPNSLARFTDPIRDRLGGERTIDAVFSGGGLTSQGGHPIEIADRMIGMGRWTALDGEGAFYWTIDSEAELQERWGAVVASRPDFIKVYLLYSEEHAARIADPNTYGWRGLEPSLVLTVVKRAHEAGLRVSAHVETAADFRTAIAAGVDEINHLPGFRPLEAVPIERYTISEADAREAAAAGVVVVTTIGELLESLQPGSPTSRTAESATSYRALLEGNLTALKRAGVKMAIGSDRYDQTSVPEAIALHQTGLFEPADLLTMWCETTARTIFPDRKVGRLAEGYEASFLVLAGNPMEDFENVRRITKRVKQGVALD